MELDKKNQETLSKYYRHINEGDFMGVMECLSEDIVFSIPGDASLLPFSGEWRGKESVSKLFGRFGGAFWIVGMSETRTITTENEVFSFNDEAFKVKTTGHYYRVPVLHHILFDKNNKIQSLTNTHDTYAAEQAFSGKAAIVQPILSGELLEGESTYDEESAMNIVASFIRKLQQKESVAEYLAPDATVLFPGDPTMLLFSGVWFGQEQVVEFVRVKNSIIADSNLEIVQMAANKGTVVVSVREAGLLSANGKEIEMTWTAIFQLAKKGRIGRVSFYLDTPVLLKALAN